MCVSSLATLQLLIRSVVAYRVVYSLWIRCPAYLLSLYHQAVAKAIHYSLDHSPLKLARIADSSTVGQETVRVPCVGTSALEQSVPACITWDHIPHPSPVPARTRPVLPSTSGLSSDPSTVPAFGDVQWAPCTSCPCSPLLLLYMWWQFPATVANEWEMFQPFHNTDLTFCTALDVKQLRLILVVVGLGSS